MSIEYDTQADCFDYHLAWPNNQLNMQMTANVLEGEHKKDVDLMVTSCPPCFNTTAYR